MGQIAPVHFFALILLLAYPVNAQEVISSQSFNGAVIPQGWMASNVTPSAGYVSFAPAGSSLTSPSFNLSLYSSVTLSFEIANGSGQSASPITVSVSSDGGSTWSGQVFASPAPSGSSYTAVVNGVNVLTNTVKINFTKQDADGPVNFRNFSLQGVYRPQLLLNGNLAENMLNGASFTAELTVGQYAAIIDKNYFSLYGAPSGVSIASVTRVSNTEATVVLSYNNTDFDNDATMGLSIHASQLRQNTAVLSLNTLAVAAHQESLSVLPLVRNNLNYADGQGPSVAKKFTITRADLAPGAGTIIVYGNSHYEVSATSPVSGFGTTAAINYNNGNVPLGTNFYVRLKAGLPVGEYNNEPVTLMGGKATAQVVAFGKVIGNTITNDLCAFAETIDAYDAPVTGSFSGATYSAINGADATPDVWYRLVAVCAGNYTATLAGFSGTASVSIFESSCPSSQQSLVAASATVGAAEVASFYVAQPGTYFIRVAATNGTGFFTLNMHRNNEAPVANAAQVINVALTSATIQGDSQQACLVLENGIEYSAINNFAPGTGTVLTATDGSQQYEILIDGLSAGTTYFFRTWALNEYGTGYGQQQTFTTLQPLLGTLALPAPAGRPGTAAGMSSFRANWFDTRANDYEITVSNSPDFDTILLSENFGGFTGNEQQPVTLPDEAFEQQGWQVNNVYTSQGRVLVGSAGGQGSLISPALNLSQLTGQTYLYIDLSKFENHNTTVQVLFSANGQNNWIQLGPDMATDAQAATFVVQLPSGGTSSKIKIQASSLAPGTAFYADNIRVANFNGIVVQAPYASVSGSAESLTVNGTEGQVFNRAINSLTAATTYYYRVRAKNGSLYSPVSNVITISTIAQNINNGILYVKKGEAGTGESWLSSMGELADALIVAKSLNEAAAGTVKQIWVATGKYRPMYRADNFSNIDIEDRDNAFTLLNGVSLYGGFAGYETSISSRQHLPGAGSGGETILTGKIGGDTDADNAFHIIIASGITRATNVVLDGFVMRDARTEGTGTITSNGNAIKRNAGGGIYNINSEYKISNVLVELNKGAALGSGIYNENCSAYLEIHNSEVSANAATSGAGIANINSSTVISGCVIKDNAATGHGGGVYNKYAAPVISFTTISGNSAARGAGMHNDVSNTSTLTGVKINGNNATLFGGAFYLQSDSGREARGTDTFTNCIITNNTAAEKGGMLYYDNNDFETTTATGLGPVFTNCTFSANATDNDGAFLYYNYSAVVKTSVAFRNSIIINPAASNFIAGNMSSGIDDVEFQYNLTNQSALGNNYNSGNNILQADPQFADPAASNYNIQTSSPAVNAGYAAYYSAGLVPSLFDIHTDVVNNPRVYDGYIDMGAYEWQEETACAQQTIWNGSSWSNGLPDTQDKAVVIEGDFTSDGNITACMFTVNSGAVNILPGHTLTVKGIVTVAQDASLTIQDNGALVQKNNVHNMGNIIVLKNSNPLYRLDYTMWSSPVSGQNMKQFSPATVSNRFFEYKYDLSGTAWIEGYWPVNPEATSFVPAKGYLIRMPNEDSAPGFNDGSAALAYSGIFSGIPNNGNITIPLSTSGGRYTAVGNPYPSPVNVAAFFAENSTVLDSSGAIYLWRKRNNAAASSYAILTLAGYVANPAVGGGAAQAQFFSGPNTEWCLAQGQGFIVKAARNAVAPVLQFNNALRRDASGVQQAFFRTGPALDPKFWLNVTSQHSGAGQMAVAYMEAASLNLDYGYDGKLLTDNTETAIYSLAQEVHLAVQARPVFDASDVVPLGFTAGSAGEFTISLDHTEGVFNQGQVIYLKDNFLGIIHNVTNRDYTFTSEAGTFDSRFEVVYHTSTLGTDSHVVDPDTVMVYKQGNAISISSVSMLINGVTIFDIRGSELYSANGINNTTVAVNNLDIAQQVIVVEVNTVKGKVSKRIVY